ncbi:MAG: hypothetical protein D9C04_05075 [Nitrosopumilus sp. B06]|nr:MAG: hypothetical protein EB828_01895 [Nitrosopumilus sp. D6]RNJ79299.1 MAG: hypothetical protein D9C04_05075 [Nitrosopumilus sp. B06]
MSESETHALDEYLTEEIRRYEVKIGADPENPDLWLKKGIAHFNMNGIADAIKCFEKVLELGPADSLTWEVSGNKVIQELLTRWLLALKCC